MGLSRPVLANLGFILQIAGLLMVLPIALGFYLDELRPLIAFLTTAVAFFGGGFLLNSFSQREDMDFKSSAVLITSAFFILGLGGAIPYLYLDVFAGSAMERFTNSYFESIAGFTTGGFSLIKDIDGLPDSLVFYRALTQWIGGLGIVFILLAFFYNKEITLRGITRVIGLEKLTTGIKLLLTHVMVVYIIYAVVLGLLLFYFQYDSIVGSISLILSSLTTGGFSTVNDFGSILLSPAFFIIIAAMLLGSMNFFMHDKIMMGRVKGVFKKETVTYLSILALGILGLYFLGDLSIRESVFHAVSAGSTSGFAFIDLNALNNAGVMILIALMFIGGMTFSTAGGIKVLSIIMFFKSIPWLLDKLMYDSRKPMKYEDVEIEERNVLAYLLFPLISVAVVFVSTFVFTVYGHSIRASLFESVAAFSLTGFTTGMLDLSTPLELKWWVILLLIVGRVEILTFLVFLKRRRKDNEPTARLPHEHYHLTPKTN